MEDRRVLFDLAVHQWLGEGGVVGFVVAVAAIAPQVDQHVALERLAETDGQPRRLHHRLRVVGVDVEYRRLHLAGHVRGIGRKARLPGRGRVA